ncbi:hypothetical protein LINGRAHAP2_LOCUS11603 [Linum grandiflorum]
MAPVRFLFILQSIGANAWCPPFLLNPTIQNGSWR